MPASRLNLIQEMGRCGRKITQDDSNAMNTYHVIYNLRDFVYLNETLFKIDNNSMNGNNNINHNYNETICNRIILINDKR